MALSSSAKISVRGLKMAYGDFVVMKDLNFDEFKRLGLLIKTIMDADQWLT